LKDYKAFNAEKLKKPLFPIFELDRLKKSKEKFLKRGPNSCQSE